MFEKDFPEWIKYKTNLQDNFVNKWCKSRQIWWCSLGVNVGTEEDGKSNKFSRPVLVLSVFGLKSALVLPLTTSKSENVFHFKIGKIDGENSSVILSQIKMIDTKRLIERIAILDKEMFLKVKAAVKNII